MAIAQTHENTLLGAMLPRGEVARLATSLLTVVVGSLLLVLSAKISVPVQPVPVTLQTMAVALIAAGFGMRIGVATVALYIAEGFIGLPVFAGAGTGPAYLLGPTGGFILSWIPMAIIIGWAADRGASSRPLILFGVMLLADALCFAIGFGWLLTLASAAFDQANVVGSAFAKAIQPFILWDVLKMAFAAATVSGAWAFLRRSR